VPLGQLLNLVMMLLSWRLQQGCGWQSCWSVTETKSAVLLQLPGLA
jgi:hypothetical protein